MMLELLVDPVYKFPASNNAAIDKIPGPVTSMLQGAADKAAIQRVKVPS